MLKNYFKIALRNVKRNPGFTGLNIIGLALGLGCFYLIAIFIQYELNFDQFHEKADQMVRLTYSTALSEDVVYANSAAGFAPLLKATIPDIKEAIRVENFRNPYVTLENGETRRLQGLLLSDQSFFEVFDFPIIRGNPSSVLEDKYSLVLSNSTAKALFGGEDPIGKTIRYGNRFNLRVTGLMADVPAQSHLQFNAVASFQLVEAFVGPGEMESFTNYNYNTYLLLHPGVDQTALKNKITQAVRQRFDADNNADDESSNYIAGLQPLKDIHLTTNLTFDINGHRDIRYLYTFGAIGLLILLIACVNFMNLATARATQRAAEVGVRKAVGAQRRQLVGQFIGESVILSLLSILIGLVIALLALPFFNEAVGGSTRFSIGSISTIVMLVFAGLTAGVLAGSYPAFYLSAFNPARVLKGDLARSGGAPVLRKGLIVFQFAASIFLVIATLTVYNQLRYMQNRNLGFDKEHVLFVSPPGNILENFNTFRQELLTSSYIEHVALAGGLPGRVNTTRGYQWPGQTVASEQQGDDFASIFADPDYLEVLDLELVAGRMFSYDSPADTNDTYLLNEAALRMLNWTPEEAVGHPFRAWDRPIGQVIGVVKDFHYQSLHQEVQPLVINYKPAWMGTIALRTTAGHAQEAIRHLDNTWQMFASGFPLEYRFLDEDFGRLYQNESRLGTLFTFFASLAIFIACLGLFGLAAYVAQQRTKEIGVRKVLGASSQSLVFLLSKDFVLLVLIALIVASPAVYFVMNRWLEGFAYHINMSGGTFLIAGILAIAIAFVTVSTHAIRAAMLNPIQSLRYE